MKNDLKPSAWVSVATLGDVRYSSAPGTVASALTIPVILALGHMNVSWIVYGVVTVCFALFSWYVIGKSLPYFDEQDPQEIVLDECLGMLIAFWTVPLSVFAVVIGFLLFRLFDISKIFGIGHFEKLPGAFGVLADDVAAGVLTLLVLRFLVPVFCG